MTNANQSSLIIQIEGTGPFDGERWRSHVSRAALADAVVDVESGAGTTRLTVSLTRPLWSYSSSMGQVVASLLAYGAPERSTAVPVLPKSVRAVSPSRGALARAKLGRIIGPWAALLPKAALGPAPLRRAASASTAPSAQSADGEPAASVKFNLSDAARRALTHGGNIGGGAWPATLCRDLLFALDDWNTRQGGALPVTLDFAVGSASPDEAAGGSPALRRLRVTPQDFQDGKAVTRLAATAMLGAQSAQSLSLPDAPHVQKIAVALEERAVPTALLATVAADPFLDQAVIRDRDGRVVLDGFTVTRIHLTLPIPRGVAVAATAVLYAGGVGCAVAANPEVVGNTGAASMASLWTARLEASEGAPGDRAEEFVRLLASHSAHKGRTEPLRGLPIGKGVRPEALGMPPQLTS